MNVRDTVLKPLCATVIKLEKISCTVLLFPYPLSSSKS